MKVNEIDFPWDVSYSIFASSSYLRTIGEKYGWIGGFINDELTFVLPYAIRNKLIFKSLVFTTDTIYLSPEKKIDQEKEYLNEVVYYFCNKKIDFIHQPSTNVVFNTYPDNSTFSPFGTYQLDLLSSEKFLWDNIHPKHRNVIRNAEKNEVQIYKGLCNKDVTYRLLKDTMNRSEMSFPEKKIYNELIDSLGNYVEIFVAFKGKEPQGCAVIPYSEFCAYYLWGGSSSNPFQGSMNLLQWEIIKHFKSIGVKKYDFVGARISPDEGSRLEGIQRFKVRFGAIMRTGYLWKYVCNPVNYKLYKSASKIKNWNKKSPSEDIIDQEIKKKADENNLSDV
jgi:hypothetical protein